MCSYSFSFWGRKPISVSEVLWAELSVTNDGSGTPAPLGSAVLEGAVIDGLTAAGVAPDAPVPDPNAWRGGGLPQVLNAYADDPGAASAELQEAASNIMAAVARALEECNKDDRPAPSLAVRAVMLLGVFACFLTAAGPPLLTSAFAEQNLW